MHLPSNKLTSVIRHEESVSVEKEILLKFWSVFCQLKMSTFTPSFVYQMIVMWFDKIMPKKKCEEKNVIYDLDIFRDLTLTHMKLFDLFLVWVQVMKCHVVQQPPKFNLYFWMNNSFIFVKKKFLFTLSILEVLTLLLQNCCFF